MLLYMVMKVQQMTPMTVLLKSNGVVQQRVHSVFNIIFTLNGLVLFVLTFNANQRETLSHFQLKRSDKSKVSFSVCGRQALVNGQSPVQSSGIMKASSFHSRRIFVVLA